LKGQVIVNKYQSSFCTWFLGPITSFYRFSFSTMLYQSISISKQWCIFHNSFLAYQNFQNYTSILVYRWKFTN